MAYNAVPRIDPVTNTFHPDVMAALAEGLDASPGAQLTPDPENPGYLIVGALSSLTEDPDNPGYLITGA